VAHLGAGIFWRDDGGTLAWLRLAGSHRRKHEVRGLARRAAKRLEPLVRELEHIDRRLRAVGVERGQREQFLRDPREDALVLEEVRMQRALEALDDAARVGDIRARMNRLTAIDPALGGKTLSKRFSALRARIENEAPRRKDGTP
jgi:hypothetical protein